MNFFRVAAPVSTPRTPLSSYSEPQNVLSRPDGVENQLALGEGVGHQNRVHARMLIL